MAARRRRVGDSSGPSTKNSTHKDDAIHKLEEKVVHALTVLWHELPVWQQDNHYIVGGYRRETGSFKKCFDSLFFLHNESGAVLAPVI